MPEGLSIIRVNWIIAGTIIRLCLISQAVVSSHPCTLYFIEKSRIEINFTQKSTFYS